jgi:hypothetical protein
VDVGNQDDLDGDAVARAIGYIAMEAARLERIVGVLLFKLLCSPIGEPVMQGQPWAVTKQACLTLIDTHERRLFAPGDTRAVSDPLVNFRALLARADALMSDRHLVIHGSWYYAVDEDRVELTTYLARRWGKEHLRAWKLAELDQLRADLADVTDQIAFHMTAISGLCP